MKEKDVSDNEAGILSSASSAIVLLKQGLPDGGTTAWLQVLGAFFMYFNTWGKPSRTDVAPFQCSSRCSMLTCVCRHCVQLWNVPGLL